MDNDKAYNDFMDVVKRRFSCRQYSSRPVSRGQIEAVLEAVRLAPSAVNRQPWRFIVVTDDEERRRVAACYSRPFAGEAPVLIIAVGLHDKAWHRGADGKDHTDIDLAIATEHLCLAAKAAGLDTCWICNFEPEALTRVLGLGPDEEAIAMIPLGYAADNAVRAERPRLSLNEIVKWGIEG